jgi:hypothetical protein
VDLLTAHGPNTAASEKEMRAAPNIGEKSVCYGNQHKLREPGRETKEKSDRVRSGQHTKELGQCALLTSGKARGSKPETAAYEEELLTSGKARVLRSINYRQAINSQN